MRRTRPRERREGEGAHLVADVVAGGVHFEELGPDLLVHAAQDGDHPQGPHVGMLRAPTWPHVTPPPAKPADRSEPPRAPLQQTCEARIASSGEAARGPRMQGCKGCRTRGIKPKACCTRGKKPLNSHKPTTAQPQPNPTTALPLSPPYPAKHVPKPAHVSPPAQPAHASAAKISRASKRARIRICTHFDQQIIARKGGMQKQAQGHFPF